MIDDDFGQEERKTRRSILQLIGAAGLTAAALSFGLTQEAAARGVAMTGGAVDLGSGDTGILNYAYALEQLEAAFYTQVTKTPYAGMSQGELGLLAQIRDHEIVHRDTLKNQLGSAGIPALEVNFGAINFGSRKSVLTTARTFEDLGVAAYNGAGQLLHSAKLLVVAGSIVSVEARHAATIRDLISPKTSAFAGDDVVDGNGLDRAFSPGQVLPKAAPFIATPVTASHLV